jgi:hypothetical protein
MNHSLLSRHDAKKYLRHGAWLTPRQTLPEPRDNYGFLTLYLSYALEIALQTFYFPVSREWSQSPYIYSSLTLRVPSTSHIFMRGYKFTRRAGVNYLVIDRKINLLGCINKKETLEITEDLDQSHGYKRL